MRFKTKKPPKGLSVQSNRGGLSGSSGFLYSQTVMPVQPAMTMTPTAAIDTKPRVRLFPMFLLSSRMPIQMAPTICIRLELTELRERVRMLKYKAAWIHEWRSLLKLGKLGIALTIKRREDNHHYFACKQG